MHVGLNLLFLTPREMGGLEVYARELAGALAARDDVRLSLFVNSLANEDSGWGELGELHRVALDPRRRIEWVTGDQYHAVRLARRTGVDLVHSMASTGPAFGPFRRVVTVHDLHYLVQPDAHAGLRGLGMRVLVPVAVRSSHRVIVPSAATRDHLIERLGSPAGKIDVVPEGVGQAPAGPGDAAAARRRLELGERPMLLTVSAKRPYKNLLRLLDALALFPPERRPLLVLPGPPTAHEQELRDRVRQLGIEASVRFLGWVPQPELEDLYAAADCFVFPSLHEGFGLPVLEAMSRGVPVATSHRSSLAEVAGDAAELFDPEDASSIAATVEGLLADPERRERLRAAGLAQAARFTWERAAAGTVAAYRRALGAE